MTGCPRYGIQPSLDFGKAVRCGAEEQPLCLVGCPSLWRQKVNIFVVPPSKQTPHYLPGGTPLSDLDVGPLSLVVTLHEVSLPPAQTQGPEYLKRPSRGEVQVERFPR
jgi:hypothetical protein